MLGCLAHPQRSAHPDEPFGTCSEWVNKDVRECQTLSQVCICVFAEHTKMLPTLEVGWEGVAREGMGLTSALKYSIEVLSLPPELLFVSVLCKIGEIVKNSKIKYLGHFRGSPKGVPARLGHVEDAPSAWVHQRSVQNYLKNTSLLTKWEAREKPFPVRGKGLDNRQEA